MLLPPHGCAESRLEAAVFDMESNFERGEARAQVSFVAHADHEPRGPA